MDFFFYGTLMDPDIRRLALGPAAERPRLEPARLHGYRRMATLRSTAPVLTPRRGASVDGLLARGLDRYGAGRLRHFEGADYRLVQRRVRLADGRMVWALVYLGAGRVPVRRAPWLLATWQRRHKRTFLRLMALWMAAYREAGYLGCGRPRWVKRWAARGWRCPCRPVPPPLEDGATRCGSVLID